MSALWRSEHCSCEKPWRDMSSKLGAKLWVRISHFDHPIDSAASLVRKHPFNRKVQLLLPLLPNTEDVLPPVPDLSAFYYSIHASLAIFTDPAFINPAIGDTSLSSVCLNGSTRAACTIDGKLQVTVSKNEYQRLGIAGSRIDTTGRLICSPLFDILHSVASKLIGTSSLLKHLCCADDFHLDIDLLALNFKPGNDHHDRVSRYRTHFVMSAWSFI